MPFVCCESQPVSEQEKQYPMDGRRVHYAALQNLSLFLLSLAMGALVLSTSPYRVGCLSADEAILEKVKEDLLGWEVSGSNETPCKWQGVTCNSEGHVWNLTLANRNLLGAIPSQIGNLNSLQHLDLSKNNLSGQIPPELGLLKHLQYLDLSQNLLEGSIPELVGALPNLTDFSAYQNRLSGPIPFNSTSLRSINLASNMLNGSIPGNLCASGSLDILILSNNSLSGALPSSLGSCPALTNLRLSFNSFTGLIPPFRDGCRLVYFEARANDLAGNIPPSLSACRNLSLLFLSDNKLTGDIPSELGDLPALQVLQLSINQLTGHIPVSLSHLQHLSLLDLSLNHLDGMLPPQLCQNPELQYLILQGNSLSGLIPLGIGNCTQLLELHLGSNSLSGNIPTEIGRLVNLEYALNLSWNGLVGDIPAGIGSLQKLNVLDLSHNRLSGSIPSSFASLQSLITYNFSGNDLVGPVPPMRNASGSSFLHNTGLCGGPLPPCLPALATRKSGRVYWVLVAVACICALAAFSVAVRVAIAAVQRRNHQLSPAGADPAAAPMLSRVLVERYQQDIDFDSLKTITCNYANLITSNHFSSIYKVVTQSGLALAAKKLHSATATTAGGVGAGKDWAIHQRRMVSELDRMSKLSHENVMRPIGYILQDEVAILLYDFVPLSSLHQRLHRSSESILDWSSRYRIALGAAQGLSFLHHSCHPAMVHLNITSNSILLGPNLEVKIGDVEIAKVLDPSKNTGSITAVAGSFGYIAPEYAFTMRVTMASNVYSFGVVLLELITGHLPTEESFGEGVDLVRWVHGASSRGETPEQILDARISTLSFSARQEMLAALRAAVQCTNSSPSRRPRMKKVVEMLIDSRHSIELQSMVNH